MTLNTQGGLADGFVEDVYLQQRRVNISLDAVKF